jgi:hypothetical protein
MWCEQPVTVPRCPLCTGSHTYRLEIEFSMVVAAKVSSDMCEGSTENQAKPKLNRVHHLFTCPVKNEAYEATIALGHETFLRIRAVKH